MNRRPVSDLLTQLKGVGEPTSPDTDSSSEAKHIREQQANQMTVRHNYKPFLQEGVDMQETYEEGAEYMYSMFHDFFGLPDNEINKREGIDHYGKTHNMHLFYVLQDMGIFITMTIHGKIMRGAGYRL